MIEIWMRNHLLSDNNYNVANSKCQIVLYMECQIMVGLHLVVVTLHRQFTIEIKEDKENW